MQVLAIVAKRPDSVKLWVRVGHRWHQDAGECAVRTQSHELWADWGEAEQKLQAEVEALLRACRGSGRVAEDRQIRDRVQRER